MPRKKLLKAKIAHFCKEARALFDRLGFQPYPRDQPGFDLNHRSLRIMTDMGVYRVHLPDPETIEGDASFDLYGRFETTPERGDYTSNLYLRFRALDADYMSGKWNICRGDTEVETILTEFTRRMNLINAHPPTGEEWAAWAADDAVKAAELARTRHERKDFAETHPQ